MDNPTISIGVIVLILCIGIDVVISMNPIAMHVPFVNLKWHNLNSPQDSHLGWRAGQNVKALFCFKEGSIYHINPIPLHQIQDELYLEVNSWVPYFTSRKIRDFRIKTSKAANDHSIPQCYTLEFTIPLDITPRKFYYIKLHSKPETGHSYQLYSHVFKIKRPAAVRGSSYASSSYFGGSDMERISPQITETSEIERGAPMSSNYDDEKRPYNVAEYLEVLSRYT